MSHDEPDSTATIDNESVEQTQPEDIEPGKQANGEQSLLSSTDWASVVRLLEGNFYLKLLAWGMTVLLLVLVTTLCKVLAPILKPVVLAIFLSYLVYPLVRWQKNRGLPGPVAYMTSFALVGAFAYLASRIVAANWRTFMSRLPEYRENIRSLDQALTDFIIGLRLLPRDAKLEVLYANSLIDTIPADAYTTFLSNSTTFFAAGLGAAFVVSFFMVFLLWESSRFERRMIRSFGPRKGGRVVSVIGVINDHIQQYLRIKVGVSAITALASAAIMYGFGLDFFATLGLIVFIFNFIPYVGSIAATFLPFVIGLAQFESAWTAFWMAFILSMLQQFMGNLVEPRWQGLGLNLSPLLILASLAFFGWLWGVVGMLVSVPLTAAIRLVLLEFEHTRSLAILFSDLEPEGTLDSD